MNVSQLQTYISQKVISGNRQTTAKNLRDVFQEILQSYVNIYDGGQYFQTEVGYSDPTQILTAQTSFVYKKYVEDNFAAINAIPGVTNGLQLLAGNIGLGTSLTQDTIIDGPYDLDFGSGGNELKNVVYLVSNSIDKLVGDVSTNIYTDIYQTATGIQLYVSNASGSTAGIYSDSTGFGVFASGNGSNNIIVIDDSISQKGLVYNNDYSSNFTNESLVTKRYLLSVTSAVTLQQALINGNALTQNSTIELAGYTLAINANSMIDLDPSSNGNVTGFNVGRAYINFDGNSDYTEVGYGTPGTVNRKGINIDSANAKIFASGIYAAGFKGMEYGADFSANYTIRSLVDKGYVNTTFLPLAGGTLTGNLNGVTPTELTYVSGATSNIQNQLNNLAIGIGGWKAAARVLVNTNINLSAPGAILDGVTMAAGDRFVPNAQTTTSQNGVYVWNGAATPATRATDCSTGGTSNTGVLGMVITIEEGTYADQFWVLTTNAPITVGTTPLFFAKGSATTYTGSNGILLTGNNFTFDYTYFSGNVTINNSGVMTIGAGQVTNSMLAGSIDLTTKVTGILPAANGGTGINNGTKTINLGSPTSGYILTSDASGNGTWQSAPISLPSQTGNTDKVLKTDGTNASWLKAGYVNLDNQQQLAIINNLRIISGN